MGVSVIAESGLEMTKLNDLRQEDEGKIKKKKSQLLLLWEGTYCYFSGIHQYLLYLNKLL